MCGYKLKSAMSAAIASVVFHYPDSTQIMISFQGGTSLAAFRFAGAIYLCSVLPCPI